MSVLVKQLVILCQRLPDSFDGCQRLGIRWTGEISSPENVVVFAAVAGLVFTIAVVCMDDTPETVKWTQFSHK